MRPLAFLTTLLLCSQAFAAARTSPAPSTITITVNGLTAGPAEVRHNGTWTLTPVMTPADGMWVYQYVDNVNAPTIAWSLTVDVNNRIDVAACPGQFHPRWAVLGDVYSIDGANQTVGGVQFLQIVANT